MQEIPEMCYDQPVLIVDGVYISGLFFTRDIPEYCRANGFGVLINMAGRTGSQYYLSGTHDLDYREYKIQDSRDADILSCFNDCYDVIASADRNKKVLIHCVCGRSRSVSMVVGYIMRKTGVSYESALADVRKLRPVAQPNPAFEKQLRSLRE